MTLDDEVICIAVNTCHDNTYVALRTQFLHISCMLIGYKYSFMMSYDGPIGSTR